MVPCPPHAPDDAPCHAHASYLAASATSQRPAPRAAPMCPCAHPCRLSSQVFCLACLLPFACLPQPQPSKQASPSEPNQALANLLSKNAKPGPRALTPRALAAYVRARESVLSAERAVRIEHRACICICIQGETGKQHQPRCLSVYERDDTR